MAQSKNPHAKIAHLEELIGRTEERLKRIAARSEPGTSRMMHTLTNLVRKHRRALHKLRSVNPASPNQQQEQRAQLQQAQREAPASNVELPAKQDQEARPPASRQGIVAGQ